ncbi:MAG TPA: aspartate aminotransferase family protein, partial [Coriobacteriia bacterium]|nr:aspartate aminotransferase family protein [Coriobacteriia bacterium]
MLLQQQQELENHYLMDTYKRKPVAFVKGEGMRLYDEDGTEYLDFLAGVGAASLGYGNAQQVQAMQEQVAKLVHASNYYYVEGRGELAEKLNNLLNENPGATRKELWKTFFANSGTEAIEGAIKIARKYGAKHLEGADTIITARRSFHGRTLAALAATGQPSKQEAFQPLPEGFKHVDLNDIPAIKQALNQGVGCINACAVLLECVQGEGGVYPCTEEYLQTVRELPAAKGILLIIDEVQTGFYRTGSHPFAFQHYGIVPDVVAMAKGIGGGMPMGAVAARGVAAAVFEPGDHGSTFGGNSLAITAANATLDGLQKMDAAGHVAEVGAYLMQRLRELPGVVEIRGKGLMVGVEFEKAVAEQIVAAG